MQALPTYPLLYQINTRVWLTELATSFGRSATLDDMPDAELDRLAALGFDWVWCLSVWQTGPAAQQVSRSHAGWRQEFQETLPDLREADIAGSGFAITGYTVHAASAAMPLWPACAHGSRSVACGCCSTSCQITWPWITRGSKSTQTTSSMAATPIWHRHRRTTAACTLRKGRWCSPTVATHILTADP